MPSTAVTVDDNHQIIVDINLGGQLLKLTSTTVADDNHCQLPSSMTLTDLFKDNILNPMLEFM